MGLHWIEIAKGAWHVLWISTLYSYAACGVTAVIEGYRTKGDKAQIDPAIERFIVSPFYVATLFTLISILFYTVGMGIAHENPGTALQNVAVMAAVLFIAQLLLEILESTFIQHDVFRLLKDQDAMRLFGIAACIYVFLVAMVGFSA
jgi:hypothetical protein